MAWHRECQIPAKELSSHLDCSRCLKESAGRALAEGESLDILPGRDALGVFSGLSHSRMNFHAAWYQAALSIPVGAGEGSALREAPDALFFSIW